MNSKLMLAIAALLGFSTACSTVRNTAKESTESATDSDSVIVRKYAPDTTRRVVVMYGVPVRKPDSIAIERVHQGIKADELTPVSEKTHDEEDPTPGKSAPAPSKPTAK